MHYLIFIPNLNGRTASLDDVGLADHVAGAVALPMVGDGPQKKSGTLYGWGGDAPPQLYVDELKQAWSPAVPLSEELGLGRYLIGFWKNNPPKPLEMQRNRLYEGQTITLGDGEVWRMPHMRELPHVMARNKQHGYWEWVPQGKFTSILEEAARWRSLFSNPDWEYNFTDGAEFLLRVLRMNYRMTDEVVGELMLLSQDKITAAILAALS